MGGRGGEEGEGGRTASGTAAAAAKAVATKTPKQSSTEGMWLSNSRLDHGPTIDLGTNAGPISPGVYRLMPQYRPVLQANTMLQASAAGPYYRLIIL